MKLPFRKKMFRTALLAAVAMTLSSCEMFEYHPYDTHYLDDTGLNKKNIALIEQKANSDDTLRFVFFGDTQRFYDETDDFVKAINARNDIDFVMHGGDITDFGLSKEYKWMNDILKNLRVPIVTIVGNHDVVGSGKEIFKRVYGDYNFSFVSHKTRFICLNTNALEFDYGTQVPDYGFMMNYINDTAKVERTIVAMHAPPYDDQFNDKSVLMFNHIIESYKNVQFCLHAHLHRFMTTDFFQNGILYYGCESVESRSYMVFTVTGNGYSYREVHF